MPSMTSTSTTSPSSFSTAYCATEAPTLPAPTTVIFGRAAIRRPFLLLGGVERRPGFEPRDLLAGHGVLDGDLLGAPVWLADPERHRLARLEGRQPDDRHAVVLLDPIVVLGVAERQREHPLLLEVGLVDAGEAADQHRHAAEVARRHRGMLAARALTVVLVADGEPRLALGLQVTRGLREWLAGLPGQRIEALAGLASEGVGRAQEHVVADLVQVTAEAQPRPGRRDCVVRRLDLGLDQHRQVDKVASVPRREGPEQLQPLAVGRHLDGDRITIRYGFFITLGTTSKALPRQLLAF